MRRSGSITLLLFCTLAIFFVGLNGLATCQSASPSLEPIDRIRLAEYFRLASQLENSCWPEWSGAPRAVLLVSDSVEFLINHPAPSVEFESVGWDSTLGATVSWRKRAFSPQFEATFPAIDITPTIVIGRAENTASKTSTRWVTTLMHEHFHQLQTMRPDYYASVDSLDLSGGDMTGMWMLNYDFPYDSVPIATEFNGLCADLSKLLSTVDADSFNTGIKQYWKKREEFRNKLAPEPRSYFSFQIWQEGIARYVEYRAASMAGATYTPSKEFATLPDFTPFAAVAEKIHRGIMSQLAAANLTEQRRVAFYPFGAGEGLLLDRVNPKWREQYLGTRFRIQDLMPGWLREP